MEMVSVNAQKMRDRTPRMLPVLTGRPVFASKHTRNA